MGHHSFHVDVPIDWVLMVLALGVKGPWSVHTEQRGFSNETIQAVIKEF